MSRPNGVIRFNWLEADGTITNWWSGDIGQQRHRFVHTEWGKFAVAIDMAFGEIQLQLHVPPAHLRYKIDELSGDENVKLALEAVVATGDFGAFACELLLRAIGRDDLAERIRKSGRPDDDRPEWV